MTRINLIDPKMLTNKHLLAEYKEITRPFNKVIKRIQNNTMDEVKIPPHYVLGVGHETFFFDKLKWLYNRYNDLAQELIERNYNVDLEKFNDICDTFESELFGTNYWKDYQPTPEEIYLNFARLSKRSGVELVLNELTGE